MRKLNVVMIGLAMLGLAACDRGQDANRLASDTALSRDLNLANQAQPFQGLDSMSALEAARQAEPAALAAAPVPRSTASSAAPTRRTASSARRSTRTYPTSTRRRSTSGGSSTASSGDIGTRSEGRVVVKKNTRRDAAIGAGAGAVIGAVTSRNKVKGAVIGGVAGGVLGAIIGNNVDVQKKRVP
jgi:YmgG-like glycine-zipper protein